MKNGSLKIGFLTILFFQITMVSAQDNLSIIYPYTFYEPFIPAESTTETSTTTDPTGANNTGTTSTESNTTSPDPFAPGTIDTSVLRQPSTGDQTATNPDQSDTSTPDQPPAETTNQPTTDTNITGVNTTSASSSTNLTQRPSRQPVESNTIPSNQEGTEETLECPPLQPLAPATECPSTEQVNIIPEPPSLLFGGPLLALLIFWAITSLLNRNQAKTEHHFREKFLRSEHQKNVTTKREKAYRNLLDFLSTETATTNVSSNWERFNKLSSQIELLGSPEMRKLSQQISAAMEKQAKPELKMLLRNLGQQIKKEL